MRIQQLINTPQVNEEFNPRGFLKNFASNAGSLLAKLVNNLSGNTQLHKAARRVQEKYEALRAFDKIEDIRDFRILINVQREMLDAFNEIPEDILRKAMGNSDLTFNKYRSLTATLDELARTAKPLQSLYQDSPEFINVLQKSVDEFRSLQKDIESARKAILNEKNIRDINTMLWLFGASGVAGFSVALARDSNNAAKVNTDN